ncbi:nucleotidyltransferase domain-containing protein [Candidatus Thiosymbion oneisti]|uniref:nucleotidyltransferase domain-containing protein n=1 Tax=Candidatus Thiosymbion oneisti TaxID=589554 RepID=UPI00114D0E8B|nr:nucleotidyltransferase domain-containing protein [Candidatus Thiosymbion oneisti]
MNIVFEKCKNVLQNYYGSQFHQLFLYGSVSTHQSDSMSDIDMLVILKKPFDYFNELQKITDLLYPIQLESEQLISVKPAPKDEFETGSIQLYRNAKSERLAL